MDMTSEAALTKFAVVLGAEDDLEVAADRMQLNLRGEQRQSVFHIHFGAGDVPEDGATTLKPRRPMVDGLDRYNAAALDRAMLRITGLHVPGKRRGRIEFKAFIDMPEATGDTPETETQFLGETSKRWREEEGGLGVFFEVTGQARQFVDNRHSNTITIASTSGEPFSWERMDIAFYADC